MKNNLLLGSDESVVTPANYRRIPGKAIEAVTVFDGKGYVTINAPRALYWSSRGALTVQGQTPADTRRFKHPNTEVSVAFIDGAPCRDDDEVLATIEAALFLFEIRALMEPVGSF